MFGFFASQEKKTRENAANWLELADKVWHFRRDRLNDREAGELQTKTRDLRQQLKAKADSATLKLSVEALESVLRRTGGAIYPKTSLVENVEFFLVAAIVIIGIRTYFVQPFKIPTNSMWPTYYGMTAENFPPTGLAPNTWQRVLRFAAFGAQRRQVIAPTAGEVTAEFGENTGQMMYQLKNDRTWLVFPTQVKEYTFYVGDVAATVRVPRDFNDFDKVVAETFFGGEQELARNFLLARTERRLRYRANRASSTEDYSQALRLSLGAPFGQGSEAVLESAAQAIAVSDITTAQKILAKLDTERAARIRRVAGGETLLRFDILTGDQLFVDRVSYHFMRPKVGQGFVFRTDHIPGIGEEQYYIKRLIGVPGDEIEIKQPVLYRNGKPIEGAESFALNAERKAPYRGYFNAVRGSMQGGGIQYLLPGEKITVPPKSFLALGDNSGSSLDGRYWGYVPEKDAVGRPLFIYYPFTKRWGPAR